MVFMIKYTIIITDAAGKKVVKLRETFAGIRSKVRAQLEEHDAKEAAKHDS